MRRDEQASGAPGAWPPEAGHGHLLRVGGRPFLVGLLHGLAGRAALTLLSLGASPSPTGALVYRLRAIRRPLRRRTPIRGGRAVRRAG